MNLYKDVDIISFIRLSRLRWIGRVDWMDKERKVYCPSQETKETSSPTRPVENVILTTKGLQERNIQLLDGTMVEK
jgi:hypothetical protein